MGCCFSTGYRPNSALKNQHHPSDDKVRPNVVATPPPDEETVKEVMSETPKSKSEIPRLEREWSKRITRPDMHKTREQEESRVGVNCKMPQPMAEDEVSDVSGLSAITGETAEKGGVLRRSPSMLRSSEFNGEMKSPPKLRNNVTFSDDVKERKMTVHLSPSRRFEPSPVRRSQPSPGRARQNLGLRRDAGEISGRRSNSPGTSMVENGNGKAVLGRSFSGRKTGPSPGRLRSDQSGRIKKVGDVIDREETWPMTMQQPLPLKESLENPSVSLECFIFL